MRKLFLTILIVVAANGLSYSQEKVNVREIVQKEFQNAKGIPDDYYVNKETSFWSSPVLIKISIIFTVTMLSFGWVGYRRITFNKIKNSKKLKEKIKTLRNEKIKYEMDPRLKIIRKKLLATVPGSEMHYETINSSAKRLNISKDEIAIAARLNLYAENNAGGSIA